MACFGGSRRIGAALLFTFGALAAAGAQDGTSTLTGVVTDPSGATVPDAKVVLRPLHGGEGQVVAAGKEGRYRILAKRGQYVLEVKAEGFAVLTSAPFAVDGVASMSQDLRLKIEEQIQQVDVSDENVMDSDPNQNGDSVTLKGKDIDNLPLDSTELSQQLQGLAGGNSPEIYVNGFSGGTLPPRDTIREIRINQNPYSAQNDTNPVNGQIQIFTKPGSDHFHGDFFAYGNSSSFNTRSPFVTTQPAYSSQNYYAQLNGPINKKMSFQLSGGKNANDTNAIVNAQVLDPVTLVQEPFTQAVATPGGGYDVTARVDAQAGKKNTLMLRYDFSNNTQTNGGIGQFNLPTQGYNSGTKTTNVQASDSLIVSAKVVNDTRFQYVRSRVSQTADTLGTSIQVQGAFTGGGNNGGNYNDNQDRYELQNYVSAALKTHFMTFGGRLRVGRDANHSVANYDGQYTFATLQAYQITEQALAAAQAAGVSPDFTAIRAAGGGASLFTQTTGNPNIAVTVADAGLFFQDDWKARKNLTVSAGLRFETQNQISDHADWAPRLGVSWGFGVKKNKPPQFVLRAGAGIFYRRFTSGYVLQAARDNGINQQQFVVTSPAFYGGLPSQAQLGIQTMPAIYQVSPSFHSPYLVSSTVSLQRQLGKIGSVTASYLETRGIHDQLTRNINAPLPGTFNPAVPGSGVRPQGGTQDIYEYESGGVDRNHRFSVNTNLNYKGFFVYGGYNLRYVRTDTNGGFPSNSYNLGADYGPAANDVRHSLYAGGGGALGYGFRTYMFMQASSGAPFNIVVGQDLNGDSQFNDRPTFATDLTRASVVQTSYGNFDTLPVAGQTTIPINYGRGPAQVSLTLSLGRSFAFGPALKPPAGAEPPKLKPGQKPHVDHRYQLFVSVDAQNVFNHPNYATPVGTLNSPLFGRSIALASGNQSADRTIDLQTYFHF